MADVVLCSIRGGVATVTLNRPQTLNALNHAMIKRLRELLREWSQPTSTVSCVVIKGAGGKAFCAGGDVKWTVLEAQAGRPGGPDKMFDDEYSMDWELSIPYVSLMNGIVMGGGVGVSVHGHFRVATERTLWAMPECAIGLYPDIGASYFLQALTPPGGLGVYLALTGARLKGVDALEAGMATHYLPSSSIPQLEQALHELGSKGSASDLSAVNSTISALQAQAGPLPEGDLAWKLPLIDCHFDLRRVRTVPGIIAALEADIRQRTSAHCESQAGGEKQRELQFLKDTLAAMQKQSPLSMCVTMKMLLYTQRSTLAECLALDSVMVRHFTSGRGDFFEGVRATLIDRTKPATWKYMDVKQVPASLIESFFLPTNRLQAHEPSSKM